jgi:hypothetical protein
MNFAGFVIDDFGFWGAEGVPLACEHLRANVWHGVSYSLTPLTQSAMVGTINGVTIYRCNVTMANSSVYNATLYPYRITTVPFCPTPTTEPTIPYVVNGSVNPPVCTRTVPDPPACVVGEVVSTGVVNLGTDPDATMPIFACHNGCEVGWSGSTSSHYFQIVGGVKNYYTSAGSWTISLDLSSPTGDGKTCSGGDAPADVAQSVPAASCAAGQTLVTGSNGFAKCYNDMTGKEANTNSASAVASATSQAQAAAQQAGQAAADAVAAAGGDAASQAAARAAAIANTVSNAPSADQQIQDSFCSQNPSDPSCKAPDDPNFSDPGSKPDVSQNWYQKKYPDGVTGVFTSGFNQMKSTPLYSLIDSFAVTVSAAEHSGCWNMNLGSVLGVNMGSHQLCIPPLVMDFLKIAFILTALFGARRIVFGG